MKFNIVQKITTKTKIMANLALIEKAKYGMQKCKEHSTKITDRASLGFVLMCIEDSIKIEKKKPEPNQEVLKLLSSINDWLVETLKSWKEQKWEEIDYETWQELINYFINGAAALQTDQIALDLKK